MKRPTPIRIALSQKHFHSPVHARGRLIKGPFLQLESIAERFFEQRPSLTLHFTQDSDKYDSHTTTALASKIIAESSDMEHFPSRVL